MGAAIIPFPRLSSWRVALLSTGTTLTFNHTQINIITVLYFYFKKIAKD
jgi:hypothetical protein